MIFVSSPYRGDTEENLKKAREYCRDCIFTYTENDIPHMVIAPHLLLPQFMDDNDPEERQFALSMCLDAVRKSDEVHVYGDILTEGMKRELEEASQHGVPIFFKDLEKK